MWDRDKEKPHDEHFMRRCIELAQRSVHAGDAPFGSLVTQDDKLIAEGLNDSKSRVSEHAEVIALHKAHQLLNSSDLSSCTLYTSCEPCPMCSFMIREYKVKRVVFALPSLFMGGYSKWPILQDKDLVNFPPYFSHPPEVLGGLLEEEARQVMHGVGMWMFGKDAKINL